MYYTNGIDEVINSIRYACEVSKPINNLSDMEFKNAYNVFLNKQSVFEVPINWDSILFTDFEALKCIAPTFCIKKRKFFASNSSLLMERLSGNFFHMALLKLKEQSEEIFDLAQFMIKMILINQLESYTNGTTHETIGLSSIDFKDNFEDQDFIELIVHQMTHMILFIDDFCHSHMLSADKERMIDTELKYKLGGTKFPAYIAFHSYIVGVEVLCFRKNATGFEYTGNYHGSTKRIIKICNEFQKSLTNEMHLFSPRGRSLFEKSEILFSKMTHQYQESNVG